MGVHELAQEPSPEAWRLLCQELDRMAEPEAMARIAELESALDKWPDDLRATMCGMTWDDEFFDGAPNPRSVIVRYLRFDRYFSGRYDHSLRTRSRRLHVGIVRRMCESPELRHLTQINFSYQLDAGGIVALAACPYFAKLNKLDVGGTEVEATTLSSLAGAEFYGRLSELSLAGCKITGATVGQLFGSDTPREISLEINPLGVEGARAIAAGAHTPRRFSLGSCELGDDGATALAKHPRPLESLVLDNNGISDVGLRGLVGGALRVEELSIRSSVITSNGMRALLAAGWPLTMLTLTDNALDDTAALLLAEQAPETLAQLWLDDNDITARGLASLLGSPRLAGLKELHAGKNRIGAFSDVAITLGNLEALHLQHNRLGDGIRALAGISSDKLVKLELAHNVIDIRALEELTGATWFSRLVDLDLSDNPLGPGAGVVLGAWPIENLALSGTELGDVGAIALFDAGLRPKELELSRCRLTDAAIEKLASSPTLERIEILTLDDNAITERGVRALMAAKPARLRQLKLRNNRLDDESIVELATWPQLLHVDVDGNPIGKQGEAALEARPVRCCP